MLCCVLLPQLWILPRASTCEKTITSSVLFFSRSIYLFCRRSLLCWTFNAKNVYSQGFKLKMDDVGNILIKRVSKGGVRVKNTTEESAVSNDILKLPGGLLEMDKPFKVIFIQLQQPWIFPQLLFPSSTWKSFFFLCLRVTNRQRIRACLAGLDCKLASQNSTRSARPQISPFFALRSLEFDLASPTAATADFNKEQAKSKRWFAFF